MDDILQDMSTDGLTNAIEANLAAWIPTLGLMGEARENDPPGVRRSICDFPISVFNSVLETRLEPDQVEPAIRAVQADAEKHGVPVLWWTGPSTRPADLGEHLKRHGFIIDEISPGMAVELAKLKERRSAPEGVNVQIAREQTAFVLWREVMTKGFEIPPSAYKKVEGWQELLCLADPAVLSAYIAWLDDLPVATSLMLLGAGVAGIYAVSTIPEARGKGIGRYITQVPLSRAREMGYKAGILQSSDMGYSVYRSLGFEEYCTVVSYRWMPDSG